MLSGRRFGKTAGGLRGQGRQVIRDAQKGKPRLKGKLGPLWNGTDWVALTTITDSGSAQASVAERPVALPPDGEGACRC
jgi:hypothetical protein